MLDLPVRATGSGIDARSRTFAVQLMKYLVVPTFVLDSNGKVIVWNAELERLTGVPASEILGTSDHWRGFYPEKRPCLADLVLNGDFTAEDLYSEITPSEKSKHRVSAENWCEFSHTEGMRYIAIDAGPIFSGDGDLLAVVETVRDITEQKQAQLVLEQLARRDGLTGIANRREFDEVLNTSWQHHVETGANIGLLLVDIDHFKKFNDHYGHQAGDDCLKRIAGLLQSALSKPDDLAARYGGEEFALILTDAGDDVVKAVAKRVGTAVNAAAIPHEKTERGFLTASVGVASTQKNIASAAELVAAADAALYAAKDAGRACIKAH